TYRVRITCVAAAGSAVASCSTRCGLCQATSLADRGRVSPAPVARRLSWYSKVSFFWMPLRLSLPRICIALGLSDPSQLFESADREAEGNESFFEFRLDYLHEPEQGVGVIRAILQRHPGCAILATCRRHQ